MSEYSIREEQLNVITHFAGFIMSIAALIFLVIHAQSCGNIWHLVSFSVFGMSLIILYGASTLYHREKDPVLRKKLRVLDHAAIFILIAGTYTPYTLVTLRGETGWIIFGVVWGIALIGIILKLFFTGKFRLLSTLLYVGMGWVIIFAINPLVQQFSLEGLFWLLAGGVAYTLGAILYNIKRIRYNHAIFHLFVILGSSCHFISVYLFVL